MDVEALAQVLYLFTVGKNFVILFLPFVGVVPFIRLGGGGFGHTLSIHLLLPHIFFFLVNFLLQEMFSDCT